MENRRAMPERPEFDTITAPLAYWANRRGRALAVAEGERAFSFAALHDAVHRRADALAAENGPAILWVGDAGSELDRLVEFCAIVETGRAAAIADPDWPAALRTTIEAGQELMRQMRGHVSGLCQPVYVLDVPGGAGKIPIGPDYVAAAGDGYEVRTINGDVRPYPPKE